MKILIALSLLLTGVVHLLPLSGVVGPLRLKLLYGIAADEPNVALLLRHRAMLFGILGAFFVHAAFEPTWQPIAFVAAFLSVGSFVFMGRWDKNLTPQISRVVAIDAVLIGVLSVGALMLAYSAVDTQI
jgi:NAD-dependent oxidoreductase involved in siderophore biosynthesis